MSEINDELKFAEEIEKLPPILENLSELMRGNRQYLQRQKYRIDNNHLFIVGQEKTIAENSKLIEEAKNKAASIIAMAEEKAVEIDKAAKTRLIEVNHLERETKKKLEEAKKTHFDATSKKTVGV